MRTLPSSGQLPYALYRADQVREFDRLAIEDFQIPGAELMERAGRALFTRACALFPEARRWAVLCGPGNNGGDGYVVARHALTAGLAVDLLQLGDLGRIKGDALYHLELARQAGLEPRPFGSLPKEAGLIIDALLGTGLDREVGGVMRQAIEAMNNHPAPVISADIPSGLNADKGTEMGCSVRAAATVTFIGLKQGLFTGAGPDRTGRLFFDTLDVPARVYAGTIAAARRLDWGLLASTLPRRGRCAHKGDFGHVLVVGGAPGFAGAARLAGEGALRAGAGAGLVSVATHPAHAAFIGLSRPELMCHAVASVDELSVLMEAASVIALGPGLGQSAWGRALFEAVATSGKPLVLDADGLNLLARNPRRLAQAVITPHPGEAARLLNMSNREIQADRFAAVEALRSRYAPVAVLKGAGSLIAADGEALFPTLRERGQSCAGSANTYDSRPPALCSAGNPGMASGGMGDVLTGIIAALMAQGFAPVRAAELGVVLHATAADLAASRGERGLIASDLIAELRPLLAEAEAC